ncbi:MAG: integrase/recombinase XerD [Rhodothermales bacterium]|jgi:integrase/recombinase XerD
MRHDRRERAGARDHALLQFLSETGARASEASAVPLGDLDLDPKTVLLHGKGQRDHVVVLTDVASDAIVHYLQTREDEAPSSPLFQSQRGGALTRFGIYSRVKTYYRSASPGLPSLSGQRVSPHIFRHSLVLRFIDAGVDLPTIGACLDHQAINTTSAYAHVSVTRKRAAFGEGQLAGGGDQRVATVEVARHPGRTPGTTAPPVMLSAGL